MELPGAGGAPSSSPPASIQGVPCLTVLPAFVPLVLQEASVHPEALIGPEARLQLHQLERKHTPAEGTRQPAAAHEQKTVDLD